MKPQALQLCVEKIRKERQLKSTIINFVPTERESITNSAKSSPWNRTMFPDTKELMEMAVKYKGLNKSLGLDNEGHALES